MAAAAGTLFLKVLPLAVSVAVFAAACATSQPRFVGPDDASYCPCTKEPRCPVAAGETCSLLDVQEHDPSLLRLTRRCGRYYVVPKDSFTKYLFDSRSGALVASARFLGDGTYWMLADGRRAPACECSGSADVRVGPVMGPHSQCQPPNPEELAALGLDPDGVGRPALRRGGPLPSADAGRAGE
jgi:hypothetical protein